MAVKHFNLPDPGEGLVEAEIVTWRVKVGDVVKVNDIIVEIETSKSLVELPVPYAGTVTALLAAEGETVEVGTPIISVDDGLGGDPAGVDASITTSGAATSSAATSGVAVTGATTSGAPNSGGSVTGAATSGAGISGGTVTDVDEKGEVGRIGDKPSSGRVANLVGYGPRVTGTKRRQRRVAAANSPTRTPATSPASTATSAPTSAATGAPTLSATAPPTLMRGPGPMVINHPVSEPFAQRPFSLQQTPAGKVLAKPPVRKLAKDLGIDLSQILGSGEGGTVTRADVEAHSAASVAAAALLNGVSSLTRPDAVFAAGERERRIPIKGVRKVTAQAVTASAFTAPHVTEFVTVDVTRMMRLVTRLRADPEFRDVKVSPLLVVAKALIIAIRRNPGVNATWDEVAQEIVVKNYVNLGIAAATPRGLMVPNIKDADQLSLRQLADAMANLVSTAREGKTQPADMSGGSITITNVGVFGVDTGTPILNRGEAAILCFGAVRQMPWVVKGKIRPRWVSQLALSFDHRLVDGDLGSRFLADLAAILHDPSQALVWS